MCNFNNQTDETKSVIHLFMEKSANEIGGVNPLLTLIEAIRKVRPHPLMIKDKKISSTNAIVNWNKTIFKDKLDTIENILVSHREAQEKDYNILNEPSSKKRKNIMNMVKTLAPVEFIVKPKNSKDGGGFSFGIFDTIDFENSVVKLNPIFIAIFFCSTEFTKKAIKYEI